MRTPQGKKRGPVDPPARAKRTPPVPHAELGTRPNPARRRLAAYPPTPYPAAPPRLAIEYVAIADLRPFSANPRDNAKAVDAVAASIRDFGFLIPIVIDDKNEIVAGHTRTLAATKIGMTDVPAIRAVGLTQNQIDAFRIADNKVAEQATWDNDKLSAEVTRLNNAGIRWMEYGFTQEEIDCLNDVVVGDCLDTSTLPQVDTSANSMRRAPVNRRCVIGEFTFFVPDTQYRIWIDGLRALHAFDQEAIEEDLKRRLGILT